MKRLLFLMVFLSGFAFSQSLYNRCAGSDGDLYRNNQAFTVQINRTSYGINFEYRDPCATTDLKQKLTSFLQNTDYQPYRKYGKLQLRVVKRNDGFYLYVPEGNDPWKKL